MDTATDRHLDTLRLVVNEIEHHDLRYVGIMLDGNERKVTVHVYGPEWRHWREALTFTGERTSKPNVMVAGEFLTRYEITGEVAGHEFIVLTYLKDDTEVGDLS